MSYFINNEQKLNDIIFADRNKEYGAYAIRSEYGNTVFRSLSYMLIGVGSIASTVFYLNYRNNPTPNENNTFIIHDSIYVIPVTLKKEDPPKPEERTDSPPATGDTKHPEISSLTIVDSTFLAAETTTTEVALITSTLNTTGVIGGGATTLSTSGIGGGGGGPDTVTKVSEPFEVDSPPEFEGGLSALYKFVGYHLKYPNWASSEGKEGIVYVKFVVDEKCKVGQLSLLNSVGYGMDEEALRVVSLIPKFKSPAKVKGHPVKVYYQMPIRFRYKY